MNERKKNILTLTVAILVSLVVIEGMLRMFEKVNSFQLTTVSKEGMIIYKPNLDRYNFTNETGKTVHVKINSLGFNSENFNEAKASGTIRIAVLGDSFTAAIGVDYDKNYSYLLTKKIQDLIAANPSSTYNKVEVLNFGIEAMSTVDEMKYYSLYVQKYHPDAVVLSFYFGNDLDENSRYYSYKDAMLDSKDKWDAVPQFLAVQYSNFAQRKIRIYSMFAIVRFANRVVRSSAFLNNLAIKIGLYPSPTKDKSLYDLGIPGDEYYYLDPLDPEREQYVKFSSDLLNNFKKQLDRDGVRFALWLLPHGRTITADLWNAHKSQYPKIKDYNFNPKGLEDRLTASLDPSIKVFNLRPIMEQQMLENKNMFMEGAGEGHFNEYGHAVTADVLAPFIFNSVVK